VSSRWCFQCGTGYGPGVESCAECGVGLVDTEPKEAEAVGSEDEPQLAYDLHDWASESRRMLDGLLTAAELDHAWQGATLIIREDDETAVDELVEQVETTTLPTLDDDREQVGVDLDGWPEDLVGLLSERLGLLGIPHEFDVDGDLVIHAEDEDAFDEVVDRLTAEAEAGSGEGPELVELDGIELNALLTELFVAADRLRRDARDADGVLGFVSHAEKLATARIPFGIDGATWKSVRTRVATLDGLLRAEDGEAAEDDDIRGQARALRDELHLLI
jgi:hypothetical protein